MKTIPFSVAALLTLIAAYVLGGYGVAVHYGVGQNFSFMLYSAVVVEVSVFVFLAYLFVLVWNQVLFHRPKHLARTLAGLLRQQVFCKEKFRAALPIFIGFMFFMSAFTSLKAMIPLIQPYSWDRIFMTWDRALHLGVDPWRLLQPVLGHGPVTIGLNVIYNLWFVVMFSVLYWQLFDLRRPVLRMRFFWTFFLVWIVNGTILATIFSSAGPCYYDRVAAAPNPYAEQMDYLRSLDQKTGNLWSLQTQDALWASYKDNHVGLGSGISAMPSVHISIAALMMLLGWRCRRRAKVFYTAFFLCILIASVHLAWHYAIDGYAGTLLTLCLWYVTGFFLREKPLPSAPA